MNQNASQKKRLIARLDIKGPNLIKGISFEGLRVIGDPKFYAFKYYQDGADELLYIDTVASLYNRNSLGDLLKRASENIFVPITVGGGLRTIEDVDSILRSGADKVAINTGAIKNPKLITDVSKKYGSQCMVLSVEAKQVSTSVWEAYIDNGRERTGFNVLEWIQKGISLGAGEILITSVDREGTRRGFDIDLIKAVRSISSVPVIASGGMGKESDLVDAVREGGADAVAFADIIHYERSSVTKIRSNALRNGINVRHV